MEARVGEGDYNKEGSSEGGHIEGGEAVGKRAR